MDAVLDPRMRLALSSSEEPPETPPPDMPHAPKAVFPLAAPAATAGLQKAEDGPESTATEVIGAGFDAEAIDRNFWQMRQRRITDKRAALLGEVSEAVFGDANAYLDMDLSQPEPEDLFLTTEDYARAATRNKRTQADALTAMMDQLTAMKAEQPGKLANLPNTMAELEALAEDQARIELQDERNEADRVVGNRADPGLGDAALRFVGAAGAAVSDIEGVATLPLGAGTVPLARAIAVESLLGATSEALTLPAYNKQAAFLGRDAPDALTQILFGATLGAALPVAGRGARLGFNALTPAGRVRNRDLIRWTRRPDATPKQRFAGKALAADEAVRDAAPPTLPMEDHANHVEQAAEAVIRDEPVIVRPEEVVVSPDRVDEPGTVRQVLDLIRDKEARGSYDTIYDGIRAEDHPNRPVTQMTINEVLAWQDSIDSRYPSEAVGGYQFLEDTLRRLVEQEGLTGGELFDGAMQDRLAIRLMRDAGLDGFQSGELSPADFGNNLAKIWAGLPVIPDTPAGRIDFSGPVLPGFARMEEDIAEKVRNIPVSLPYQRTVSGIVRALGPAYDVRVTSGAQPRPGDGPRTGSHRHDVDEHGEGHTADLVLLRDGKPVLPGDDPALYARFFEIAAPFFPGMGHYSWGIHVGGGKPAFWGPDRTSATANPVFTEAYQRGREAGTATGQSYYAGDGLNSALLSVDRFYHILSVPGAYTAFESGAVHRFPASRLRLDPDAYQYKASDESGLTERLQFERDWDPAAGIGVMVHERLDGTQYIADGHQRLGLARRLETDANPISLEGHLYREADGFSVEQVRTLAALKNIRQESGTPLDAARIIRDRPEMTSAISRTRGFMQQADGLAQLAPGPYRAIVNEVIPQNYAAIVGRIMPRDEELQSAAIAVLSRADPPNVAQAEAMVRDVRRLGLERRGQADQGNLFGEGFDLGETAIRERARVIDGTLRELRRDKTTFARLAKEGARIEEAGNVLNQSENLSRQQLAERATARLLTLADEPGPVQDAIDAAAKRVKSGEPDKDVIRHVIAALERGGDDAGASTSAAGGTSGAAPASDGDLIPAAENGTAPPAPDLFGDGIEAPGVAQQVARLDAEVRDILAANPDATIVSGTTDLGSGKAIDTRVSDLIEDIDQDQEFFEQLTLCNPTKGN